MSFNNAPSGGFFRAVYELVRRIPPGCVATYGQIAAMLGHPRAARTVGWALHALPHDSDVPWWRVINAAGRPSIDCMEHSADLQRLLLEKEGIVFDERGCTDLSRFRWQP
ncbi:MAG: MGMT family protein [candidate division KSB1 bacterium]|nr:MGMT family protein [candidate division KSB1 bacterium]